MNLDRFDGYPDGEEQVHPPPTAWERWRELGFDPAEEAGPVEDKMRGSTSSVTFGDSFPSRGSL